MNWLSQFWESLTLDRILIFGGLFLASLAFSFIVLAVVMVKIPENYFSSHYQQDFMPNSRFLVRWGVVIAKNLLGVFLVILGIILSLPGVPGQGLLTILLGLIMLDIPGKRPLEARIIKRPTIRAAINNLRARFNKPPLVLD
nr:PMP-22/EMP/MP20/Claudin tight junction [uncultured bacterium]